MPMLDPGWDPDDVAGPDLLNRLIPELNTAGAGGDKQNLTTRMRVPGGAGAGRERHESATGM